MTGLGEADTCRKFVVPKLVDAGWDKRDKKWFSRDDVNQAIDGLVAKGWLEVRRH